MVQTVNKNLILLRHGKSDWNDPSTADIDRPLKPRGINDSIKMGKLLRDRNILPDIIISSPANRAIHSSILLCRGMQMDPSLIQLRENLYLASPDEILSQVYGLNNHIQTVLITGHNPGMTLLADEFAAESVHNLPTAGLAFFSFEAEEWNHISTIRPNSYFIVEPQKRK